MRRLLVTVLVFASCGPEPDPPPPCEDRCCVSGSTATKRCGSCSVGEVAVTLARCEPTDAAVTCGNGKFESSTEQCDTSAQARCTDTSKTCMDCACVPKATEVCGDGMVVGREDCETTAACGAGRVCRRCQCANTFDQVVFSDTINDTPLTAQGYGIESVALIMDGGDSDSIIFNYGELNGMQPDMLSEVCFVVVVAAGQEQRLCIQKGPANPRELAFKDVNGARRPVLDTEALLSDTGLGFRVNYFPTLGLRAEPDLAFYVESSYAGQKTDALPDSGNLSFHEVFGM